MLYTDTLSVLDELDDAQCGKLFRAIRAYHEDDTETLELLMKDTITRLVFAQFKTQFVRDQKRYDDKVEKRRAAGVKGNQKRWGNKSQSIANIANATNESQSIANIADSVSDSVSDSVLQDTNVSMCSNNITSPSNEEDVLQNEFSNSSKSARFSVFVKLWNDNIRGTGQHAITDIKEGTQRRTWVSARLKEYGEDAVKQVIINATSSSFLCGVNKKGVVYGFDWIMRPNNFPKVLEGNYNDESKVVIAEVKSNTDYQDPVSQKNQNAAEYENWRRANGLPDNQETQLRFFHIKSRT